MNNSMEEKELKEIFEKALKLVEGLPDKIKPKAFEIAVHKLLKDETNLTGNKSVQIASQASETIAKKNHSSSANSTLETLEIEASLDGFPNLYKLGKGQQILWILTYCSGKGINELSTSDISYVATRFKLDIPAKNVPALSKTNFTKGYLSLKNGKMRILQPGIEALKGTEE